MHQVSWNTICKPKQHGGLSFRLTSQFNEDLIMKVGWGLIQQPNSLWGRVLRSKYGCGNDIVPTVKQCGRESLLWRGIRSTWKNVISDCRWRVGNSSDIWFWKDSWIMSGHVLLTLATNPIPLASLDLSLSSYYDPDSGWRTELFVDLPPHNIVEEITSFHSIHDLEDRDEGFWYGTPSGAFSTKSAYELVSPIPNDRTEEAKWKSLWRIKGPQRVRVFLWKLCNRGILTNAICVRRHMGNCDLCPLCRSSSEDYLHLFRDCSAVSDFWHAAWKGGRRDAFFHANWDEWITENITGYLQGNCELD